MTTFKKQKAMEDIYKKYHDKRGRSTQDAIKLCIGKWMALADAKITRKDLYRDEVVGVRTCALCLRYWTGGTVCPGCPLDAIGENCLLLSSTFSKFNRGRASARKMQRVLEKALANYTGGTK